MVAFVVYNIILIREGRSEVSTPFKTISVAVVLYLLSAAMLAGIIWPLVVLSALFFFLHRAVAGDKPTRYLSVGLIALFILTGAWRFVQAKNQGKYWLLSRTKAGGPGLSYFRNAARDRIFSDVELAKFLQSENSNEPRNAKEILKQRIREVDSYPEIDDLEKALGDSLFADEHIDLREELDYLKNTLKTEETMGSGEAD